jgi:hypothetical protein
MLFNVETDTGDRITGYLVPDGYSEVPTIQLRSEGITILSLTVNELREALVVAGRHETGRCGFSIGVELVSDLSKITDLEIRDAETGVLVYRRPNPSSIQKKLLRLESHLFPLWRLDDALGARFQYYQKGVESFGRETVTQLFLLNQVNSVYLSGRILFKNYAYYVESGFETICIVQDPYSELAERLLVLSNLNRHSGGHLGLRENVGMRSAIDFAEHLLADESCLQDVRVMRRRLREMSDDVAATLANPVARMLTSSSPDEMPSGGAIASALDLLASFAVVGIRSAPDQFLSAVAELTGVELALPPIPRFSNVEPLAQLLRESGQVDGLLETDLELYNIVSSAWDKLRPDAD